MTSRAISALSTVRAVALGYAPRVLQARGWVLCALAVAPVALSFAGSVIGRQFGAYDSRVALQLFHGVLVSLILPIMVLVAAPGGIRAVQRAADGAGTLRRPAGNRKATTAGRVRLPRTRDPALGRRWMPLIHT